MERALIARAQPHYFAARAQGLIQSEAGKGCWPNISPFPVSLEPPFQPIGEISTLIEESGLPGLSSELPSTDPHHLKRVRVWISPEQGFDWVKSELFVKSLKDLTHRIGFEVVGNSKSIEFYFLVHQGDLPELTSAFTSQYERCELTVEASAPAILSTIEDWTQLALLDFYPLPPYSHLFTQPEELKVSPYNTIITSLAGIDSPALGIFQLLFQGVSPEHNWHQNVNTLNDMEYAIKLMSGMPTSQRVPFQSPSGELRGMAMDTEKKAHNDKPFFAAAMRMGVTGTDGALNNLQQMKVFANLFQHGGRSLAALSDKDYQAILTPHQLETMLLLGETYRPGFILNSSELTGMMHLPPPDYVNGENTQVVLLETLPAKSEMVLKGTPVGICHHAGTDQIICIPPAIRSRSTHLIARQGMGKSTLLEHMALHDIASGAGVAIMDPHGDLIRRLLCQIPERYHELCILFCPADRDWVPLWNPLQPVTNQDLNRTADDLVAAIKNIVQGWGDRLENLLRHSFCALLKIKGATLLDVSNLLRKKSPESALLIAKIEQTLDSEMARLFWKHDFHRYSDQDLSPPQHKLSKLLMSGTVSMMLSQPENRFDFRDIMDSGKILLVDLSGIGFELRELLGSFILSLLHISAVSRSDIPFENRKPFHIYCDEAHRFLPASIEDLIPETRKFAVDLTLAHQYLNQFDHAARDSILTSGSTIIFNVDLNDARYLVKDLRDRITPEEIASLEVGDAVARIGTEIIRIKTPPPAQLPTVNARQLIIDETHRKYCKPASEVKEALAARCGRRGGRSIGYVETPKTASESPEEVDFRYEEFD